MNKKIKNTLEMLVPFSVLKTHKEGISNRVDGIKFLANVAYSVGISMLAFTYTHDAISTGSFDWNEQNTIMKERKIVKRKEKEREFEELKRNVFEKVSKGDGVIDYKEFKEFCDTYRLGKYELSR